MGHRPSFCRMELKLLLLTSIILIMLQIQWLTGTQFEFNFKNVTKTSTVECGILKELNDCCPDYKNSSALPAYRLILAKTMAGRLGNHLFQFASTYALARDNGMTPMLIYYHDLINSFSNINTAFSDFEPGNGFLWQGILILKFKF